MTCKVGSEQDMLGFDFTKGTGLYRFNVVYRRAHHFINDDFMLYREVSELIGDKIVTLATSIVMFVSQIKQATKKQAGSLRLLVKHLKLSGQLSPRRGATEEILSYQLKCCVSSLSVDEPL